MDDLVVIGTTENNMFKNLEEVFQICRKRNLKLNPRKCQFFRNEVTCLGHKRTDKGILPDDSKFDIIRNFPTPKNPNEIRRFIAFCNYYRKFIRNFAHYSASLTKLIKKNVKFNWDSDCKKAFDYLKTALLNPPILQYPAFEKEFCITTDASKIACGAILSQEKGGIQLPIAYASRSFTKGEQNKSVIEKELAAIH